MNKKNLAYKVITDKIIEKLEEGVVPWVKPWQACGAPKNLISKKEYRSINAFVLNLCGDGLNPYFVTFKQCTDLGGKIKKGEKSIPVVFWKMLHFRETSDASNAGGEIDGNDGDVKKVPMLKYYNVFNVGQCENIDESKIPEVAKMAEREFTPIETAENVIHNWEDRPRLTFVENRAYYAPASDKVNMPKKEFFDDNECYYAVLFHEYTHATGHMKRLNRPQVVGVTGFGSQKYSKEELIAEMGSCFITNHCGIEVNKERSAAYINGWLEKLKGDVKLVVQAAGKAQKAADLILGSIELVETPKREKAAKLVEVECKQLTLGI